MAKLTLLDVEQGCGSSGSCWAPACDTGGQNRSQRKVLGASCRALSWSLSGHRVAHCTPQLCFPRAGSHVWVFPLVLDSIPESPCPKGTLVFMVEGGETKAEDQDNTGRSPSTHLAPSTFLSNRCSCQGLSSQHPVRFSPIL